MRAGAAGVPAAEPGSRRYFVLLYTPAPRRAALATLLAVADELESGLRRQLDHQVVHVRLDWWRQEAARQAGGRPAHPWLVALRADGAEPLPLEGLVEAAGIDLATTTLAGRPAGRLGGARFLAAAQTLHPGALGAADTRGLETLGEWVAALEGATAAPAALGAAAPDRAPAPPLVRPIAPALQPVLAPLLVWAALAYAQNRPGARHTRLRGVADNFLAWRTARRACRHQFSFE